MAVEIERRFLVRTGLFAPPARGTPVRQGYVAIGPRACVRVRLTPEGAWLTLKEAAAPVRTEFEYSIPPADAEAILARLCDFRPIDKTRYEIRHAGRLWEVDVFHADNEGLVLAEVELDSPDASLELPPWVGREVTGEERYANAALAQRPWRLWSPGERG